MNGDEMRTWVRQQYLEAIVLVAFVALVLLVLLVLLY